LTSSEAAAKLSDARSANSVRRTLTTIATPIRGFTLPEKLTKGWPLVWLYQLAGPSAFLVDKLSDSLLGSQALSAQPERAAAVMASFAEADRSGMAHAMRSVMLHRNDIDDLLERLDVPTLVMSARDDAMGWRPEEARRVCSVIADCRVEEVAGGGHVAPLLIDGDRITGLLDDFWSTSTQRR
jgi:pimeloyl-ACP methyl ester carboxylesterase